MCNCNVTAGPTGNVLVSTALASGSVVPLSLDGGATGEVSVGFTSAVDVPVGGKVG